MFKESLNCQLRGASNDGQLEVVKYLVSKGANIHVWEEGALEYASLRGQLEVVKYLVSKGADIYAQDTQCLKTAKDCKKVHVINYLESTILKEKRLKELAKV